MALQTIGEVRRRLQKRWDRGTYLADTEPLGDDAGFPLREGVGSVSARALHEEYETVRAAAAEYRTLETRTQGDGVSPGITVEWTQRNDRRIGTNSIPAALQFPTIGSLAQFLGKAASRQLATYRSAAARLLDVFPVLHGWIITHPVRLTELTEPLEQLIAVTHWIVQNPRPGIYIRQIPVDGIDTKFVEGHTSTLTEWLDALRKGHDEAHLETTGDGATVRSGRRVATFARRYGFRLPPESVRFRLLTSGTTLAGYTDLRVPIDEFAEHPPGDHHPGAAHRVFIVENEITGLAFPAVDNAIVIFGGGYSVGTLASVRWLSEVPVYYWGDIDTHGFAILNRLRAGHQHAQSILMDRETLDTHGSRWSRESQQFTGDLPYLSRDELSLFEDLRNDRLGEGVRLEQERIDYSRVTVAIAHAVQRERSGTH
ncbi:MAG: Wadjet anti-phage system protein JetD domain-containing protein [Alkalispirochaeta sp.]